MDIEIDEKSINILSTLVKRLEHPHANYGALNTVLPNGEEVKSLEELAALHSTSVEVAAIAVLQAKDAPVSLVAEAKDVHTGLGATGDTVVNLGTPRARRTSRRVRKEIIERAGVVANRRRRRRKPKKDESKGLWGSPDYGSAGYVCVFLNPVAPGAYAIPGGLKEEELHVTLAFYGKLDDLDDFNEQDWIDELEEIASDTEAIMAAANGITRFSTPSDEDRDPLVVNIDSPLINPLRDKVMSRLGEQKSEHGYTPHMTIAYIDRDDEFPMKRYEAKPIILDGFILAVGKKHTRIPFLQMGTKDSEGEEED